MPISEDIFIENIERARTLSVLVNAIEDISEKVPSLPFISDASNLLEGLLTNTFPNVKEFSDFLKDLNEIRNQIEKSIIVGRELKPATPAECDGARG